MSKINCSWTTCRHNNSEYANDDFGVCTKEDIILEHKTVDEDKYTEPYNNSLLNCMCYKENKNKKYK